MFKKFGNFIQLFAVQTTLLNTTGNDLSPEMKTFYDKALLYAAQPHLVHHQFGQSRNIPKNGGKTIEFRKFTPLGKALMGKRAGDRAQVTVEGGSSYWVKVLSVTRGEDDASLPISQY